MDEIDFGVTWHVPADRRREAVGLIAKMSALVAHQLDGYVFDFTIAGESAQPQYDNATTPARSAVNT